MGSPGAVDGTTLTLVDEIDDTAEPVARTAAEPAIEANDLPWWMLLVAVVFIALGFAAPGLWFLGFVALAVWAAGFQFRHPGATWYGW